MLRYNNIIVNQGKGIVTTLEHLKLFFLNKSAKIDGIPRSLTQYEKTKGNGDNYEAPSPFQSGLLNLYNQDFSSMYSYPSLNDNSIENISMNFENIDPRRNLALFE